MGSVKGMIQGIRIEIPMGHGIPMMSIPMGIIEIPNDSYVGFVRRFEGRRLQECEKPIHGPLIPVGDPGPQTI